MCCPGCQCHLPGRHHVYSARKPHTKQVCKTLFTLALGSLNFALRLLSLEPGTVSPFLALPDLVAIFKHGWLLRIALRCWRTAVASRCMPLTEQTVWTHYLFDRQDHRRQKYEANKELNGALSRNLHKKVSRSGESCRQQHPVSNTGERQLR